ncbi:2-(1,2-epoxy-1,2-dihydrophenyl)acetyl-CoA isomerase [Nocardia sp. GAS34]|uniref:enoyl-CoA hydratase/isomerase family protein n=1 Tax=unclassified Nocardia TaxID=2637762 RepID=UPI003D1BEEEA
MTSSTVYTTADSPVLFDRSGPVATIVLNRPRYSNAIDMATARYFAEAVATIERSPDVRVVVLRAEGRNFCAGGDVTDMSATSDTGTFIARLAEVMHEAILGLARLEVPVVAAVQGAAAGAGLGLVLSADLVVCTEPARFRTAYSGIGLSPDCGVTYWLPRVIGAGHATQMMLTNRVIDADTAWQWGLVTDVAPGPRLDDHVAELVSGLVEGSGPALGEARRLLRGPHVRALAAHLDEEAATITRLASGADARARIDSFARR